jgi:hypothetical protein
MTSAGGLLLLCASSFAGAFFGQRIRLPAIWMRYTERLALRAAGAALELERKEREAMTRAALRAAILNCPHHDCPRRLSCAELLPPS